MINKYNMLINKDNLITDAKPNCYEYDYVDIEINKDELIDSDTLIEDKGNTAVIRVFIEKETNKAFNSLKEYMKKRHIILKINEAGRSIEKQEFFREKAIEEYGESFADKYVAKPYTSEHHSGLAVDVGIEFDFSNKIKVPIIKKVVDRLSKPRLYKYLHKKGVDFGFIHRYQGKFEDITHVKDEPWHIRYVGHDVAKDIDDNNISLEEYVNMLQKDKVISRDEFVKKSLDNNIKENNDNENII